MNRKIRRVLCPTDFSETGDRGVRLAGEICQRFGADLALHYNVDSLPPLYLASLETIPESMVGLEKTQEDYASEQLKELRQSLPPSLTVDLHITRGLAANSILGLARDLPADLIVMGTHGRSGLSHMLVGSTTERVVVQSGCPVLTVRDHARPLFARGDPAQENSAWHVLVPIDFSPHSLYTMEYAFGLMGELPFHLHLLRVVEPISWDGLKGATPFNIGEFQRYRTFAAEKKLKDLVPENFAGRTMVKVLKGAAAGVITTYAEAIDARMIIMGIRPKTRIQELFFGAVSYGVLRASSVPVWIVPGPKSASRTPRTEQAEAVSN